MSDSTDTLTSFEVLDELSSYVGMLLGRARAIQFDCEVMQREPTKEERDVLDGAAFLIGDGSKPVGIISQSKS